MSAPGAGRRGALAAGFIVLFVGTGVNFAFGILPLVYRNVRP